MISVSESGVSLPRPSGDLTDWVAGVGVRWRSDRAAARSSTRLSPPRPRPLTGSLAQYVDVPGHEVRLYGVPLFTNGEERHRHHRHRAVHGFLLPHAAGDAHRHEWPSPPCFSSSWGSPGAGLLNAAFRPVSRMTAEAEAWSTEDLDRRFEMGEPHDELTQLAHTLDGMLDRLAASLRREQRFSAEVSHQLRTPVAKIKAEAELALRRPRDPDYYQEALGSVLYSADQMARTVEALLAAAQEEGSLARGGPTCGRCWPTWSAPSECWPRRTAWRCSVQPPARDLRVGVERDIAAQILQPVVENACRFAQIRGAPGRGAERQGGLLPGGGRRSRGGRRGEGAHLRARRAGLGRGRRAQRRPRRRTGSLAGPPAWPGPRPGDVEVEAGHAGPASWCGCRRLAAASRSPRGARTGPRRLQLAGRPARPSKTGSERSCRAPQRYQRMWSHSSGTCANGCHGTTRGV